MAPERFANPEMYPAVMVYLGKTLSKFSSKGEEVHRLRRYGGLTDMFDTRESMAKAAEQLRQLTWEELQNKFQTRSFREFNAGAVIIYTSPRKVALQRRPNELASNTWIVNYEVAVPQDDFPPTGEVYIPSRYGERLEKQREGIVVFRGIGVSKTSNNDYYDLEFLTAEESRLILQ